MYECFPIPCSRLWIARPSEEYYELRDILLRFDANDTNIRQKEATVVEPKVFHTFTRGNAQNTGGKEAGGT